MEEIWVILQLQKHINISALHIHIGMKGADKLACFYTAKLSFYAISCKGWVCTEKERQVWKNKILFCSVRKTKQKIKRMSYHHIRDKYGSTYCIVHGIFKFWKIFSLFFCWTGFFQLAKGNNLNFKNASFCVLLLPLIFFHTNFF